MDTIVTKILSSRDYVKAKISQFYQLTVRWFKDFTYILLLVPLFWLRMVLTSVGAVIRMETSSFFTINIWCNIFSMVKLIGMLKFVALGVVAALVELFVGFNIDHFLLLTRFVFFWFHGSFWTTLIIVLFGGMALTFGYKGVSRIIMTIYSVYIVWALLGWLGLFLALNLSCFSIEHVFIVRKFNKSRGSKSYNIPQQTAGIDSHLSSEDEIIRLLNSKDYYSALGLSIFQEIDVSILKREYRKKAMLVHPDKNMGNAKAAEAFKKLQTAYEVLQDASKRKTYDDRLRWGKL